MTYSRATSPLVLAAVLFTLVLGAQPASASLSQADALIKGGGADANYLGDQIYNQTAAGQTKSRILQPNEGDSFRIAVQNDYFGEQTFAVQGDGGSDGFKVRYFQEQVDITEMVVDGNFETSCLGSQELETFRVRVTAGANVKDGASNTTLVNLSPGQFCGDAPEVAGEGQCVECDTVGAKVTVRRRAGDANGQAPRI